PAFSPRTTTAATSRDASQNSATLPGPLTAEFHLAVFGRLELTQTRKRRGLSAAEIGQNIVHHLIEAVCRFGLGDAGFTRQVLRDIGLLHSDSTLTGSPSLTATMRRG